MKTSQLLKLRTLFPSIAAVLVAMIFLTPTARANTATFDLTEAGNSGALDGVDTSPYHATINGVPTIAVICDDFVNESFVPESWTANVTPLGNYSTTNSLLFINGFAPGISTQSQAYAVAAYLAGEILQAATSSPAQEDLSFAMWEVFDPSAGSGLDSTDQGYASTDLQTAISNAGSSAAAYTNVTVYTYDPGTTITCPGGTSVSPNAPCGTPQEFIVVTPEPTSTLLFGTGLLGIIFVMRKRLFA